MNMFKKNGGFTLVELIVVIAILAILAGVAVPMYSGYINKANEAADMTQLDAIKTAVFFKVAEEDAAASLKEITVTVDEEGYTVVAKDVNDKVYTTETTDDTTDVEINITEYVGTIAFESDNNTATWTAASAKWALSTAEAEVPESSSSEVVGG